MKKILLPPLLLIASFLFSQANEDSLQLTLSQFNTPSVKYKELGIPYMQHYEAKDYDARPDNHAVVQGDNGMIYFGNGKGILEFDGIDWRLIQLPNQGLVMSLTKNKSGKIFAGGFNELGYLKPDSLGFTTFHSLKTNLDSTYNDFGYLGLSFSVNNDIYFQGRNHMFRWANDVFKAWPSESNYLYGTSINETVYVQEHKRGLLKLENDEFQLIAPITHRIAEILPFDEHKLLVATRNKGLFFLEDNKFVPFHTSVDTYLEENIISRTKLMPNGWITIGTGKGGLVVLDQEGSLVHLLDKANGLLDNTVVNHQLDEQGGLWLALYHGISRVELLSPYTIFDERLGVDGFVNDIARNNNELFVANTQGVLRLNIDKTGFERLAGIEHSLYLKEMDQSLFMATNQGVFQYDHGVLKKINSRKSASLLQSKKNPSILYVGMGDGLAVLKKQNGKWNDLGEIEGIKDDIRELVELDDGKLWMESQIDGAWLIDFYNKDTLDVAKPVIKRFQANKELPPGWLFLHYLRGEAVFEIDGAIYKYNTELDSIMPDTSFGDLFGFKGKIVPKLEDKKGNLWMSGQFTDSEDEEKQRTVSILQKDGSYKVVHINDKRITQDVTRALLPEESGVLWYGGPDGVIRQDLKQVVPNIENFKSHIRKIAINTDSLVYGGTRISEEEVTWLFENNTVRFEFSSPSYSEISQNEYQYYLEGYDQNWSDWTEETKKDYTQIPEGNYTFKVKAKNIYQQVSKEDSYAFSILPPWYRTWWAYLIYFLLFIFLLWAILQWRSRQLKAKNEALERLIAVRTSEVQHQANQLKIQAEKLLELDKAKSRFFANISHEFRTPLTLIKGPIEQLEQNFDEKLSMENVKMIRRNSNRVLHMVNQLLNLSKIDDGSLKLALTEGDIYKCLRAATSSFNSHAAQRNIDYKVQIPQAVLWTSFDRDKLENVVYNLLGNAFKFSEDGAEISFDVTYSDGGLRILVADSGKGIPKEKLPFVFDRFYQVDSTTTKEKEGSGIGLSLSKDLVELMDGTITVSSELNEGTFFTLQLPIEEIKTRPQKMVEPIPQSKKTTLKKPFALSKTDKRDIPNILLVEDNADMRHFIKENLIAFYKVTEAINGEAGLKKATANSPNLIITDLMMPKMDGIELCKKLKTGVHTSHIPVIMLTAKAGMDNKIEGLETGADDYLTKPFDAKELLVRTKNLIEQRQKLRELYSNKEVQVDPKKITVTSIDQRFLEEVIILLEEQYSTADFGVPQMQEALAMSKTQLHRKLKALTNEAPG
ncbi:MAG: ATP-binding protein, partial [Aurantibacter sp.]